MKKVYRVGLIPLMAIANLHSALAADPTAITLSSTAIAAGGTASITPTPTTASLSACTTSNPSVATVTNGVVTGMQSGLATITCSGLAKEVTVFNEGPVIGVNEITGCIKSAGEVFNYAPKSMPVTLDPMGPYSSTRIKIVVPPGVSSGTFQAVSGDWGNVFTGYSFDEKSPPPTAYQQGQGNFGGAPFGPLMTDGLVTIPGKSERYAWAWYLNRGTAQTDIWGHSLTFVVSDPTAFNNWWKTASGKACLTGISIASPVAVGATTNITAVPSNANVGSCLSGNPNVLRIAGNTVVGISSGSTIVVCEGYRVDVTVGASTSGGTTTPTTPTLTGISLSAASISIGQEAFIFPVPTTATLPTCTSSNSAIAAVTGNKVSGVTAGTVSISCNGNGANLSVTAALRTYDEGFADGKVAGIAACKANPSSCGISTSSNGASYDPVSNLLRIPYVSVGTAAYSVELNLFKAEPMQFQLKSVVEATQ